MLEQALDQAVGWLMDGFVRSTLNMLWRLLAVTLFHLPDVTGLPQVQSLSGRSLFVVNTVYILAVTAVGIAVMTQGTLQDRYGAGELLPRLVIGLVAANFAVPLTRFIISTANSLVLALTGRGIATDAALGQLRILILRQLANPASALLMAVIGLVLILIVVMLIVGWVTRFIALVVICGIAPVALACHGTPWTDGIATLWWRVMGGIVATVVLQAVALNTTLSILLDPRDDLSLTPDGMDPSGLLNLFVVACLLWFTARIPAFVGQYLTQSGARNNVFGAIVRLVIVQQLTRGLGRGVRTAASRRGPAIDQVQIPYWRPRPRSASASRITQQRPTPATRPRASKQNRPAFMDGVTPLTAFGRPGEQKRPATTWTPPDPRAPARWRHPGTRWAPGPGSAPGPRPAPVSPRSATDWAPVDPRHTRPARGWTPPDERTPVTPRAATRTRSSTSQPRPGRPAATGRPASNRRTS